MDLGHEPVTGNGLSDLVKTVLLSQSIGLALLSFWLGKEYQNNIYLRQYVHDTAWSYLPILAFTATFLVAMGVSEAYARLSHARRAMSVSVETPVTHGLLLTGGFAPGSPVSSPGSQPSTVEGQGQGDGSAGLDVSFAQVFTDSRPPAVLKHVEPDKSIETYSPPPFPVVRRLEPVRDPVEEARPQPTPRPLNRVGMPPGFDIPAPPVIRQIGRGGDAEARGREVAFLREAAEEESAAGEDSPPRRESRSTRSRPVKKKQVVGTDLTNDLTGG